MAQRRGDNPAARRARMRAWWWYRQGLAPAAPPRSIEACVRTVGWIPTAGGPGVYLTVRARMRGATRDAIDRAAVDGSPLIEVPGPHARPPVLVTRQDMALALRLHGASYARHFAGAVRSGHVNPAAIHRLAAAVCRVLDEGPLSSAGIRARVKTTDDASHLTGALIQLALKGAIRRFSANARLDSPKYSYELIHPDDRPNLDAEGDDAAVAQKAVTRYLGWHGPATIEEICAWSELSRKAARAALETLRAQTAGGDAAAGERWLLPHDLRAWEAFDGEDANGVALLPFRDPLVAARQPLTVLTERPQATILRDGTEKRLADVNVLHHHTIVSRGEIVGVWEYDPGRLEIVTRLWNRNRRLESDVAAAAADLSPFIREQLGDAKLSDVDPPGARAARIAFCRTGAALPSRFTGVRRRHASSPSRA